MKETAISRKEKIQQTAVQLFASNGFDSTSTKELAQEAGVSEALIFKHFGNKDRLLMHVIKSGYSRIVMQHKGMLTYQSAKDFLRKMILLPNKLVTDDPMFWKMQERLAHHPFSKAQHEHFMKPVNGILTKAFSELDYHNPELETQFLLLIIDLMWKREAAGDLANPVELASLIEKKYELL